MIKVYGQVYGRKKYINEAHVKICLPKKYVVIDYKRNELNTIFIIVIYF